MTKRWLLVVWLVAVWVALWGDLSVANLLSGLAVATVLLVALPVGRDRLHHYRVRPLAVLRLVWHFVRKLVESNVAIIRTVIARDDRIRTGVISVPVVSDSDVLLTVVANLTALTPGMMAIEVERDPVQFYVHVLRLEDVERSRNDVLELERLVVEAFGAPEAVAAVREAAAQRRGAAR